MAAAFAGTQQKCMACDKTVYLVDKLTADNRIYHKACFRCHHCKGTLKAFINFDPLFFIFITSILPLMNDLGLLLGNYNSFEGVLYCRPHFDQLFKRTGSLDKSFEGTTGRNQNSKLYFLFLLGHQRLQSQRNPLMASCFEQKPNVAKVSTMFGGTREKCVGCKNTVYPTEKVSVNGTPYHKSCFKCSHGGCVISPSNYIAHEGRLYCKHHHNQLIKEKGNLSQLEGEHEKTSVNANERVNGKQVDA
ncbi:LIM domain-containing protein WLIM1 [Citrus sinensis]|nr:LIM domain-containing protein WLIM1 [Citrus sinensis]